MRISKNLRDFHIGISAGLVAGITIWAYNYFIVDMHQPVWLAVLLTAIVFFVLYFSGKPRK